MSHRSESAREANNPPPYEYQCDKVVTSRKMGGFATFKHASFVISPARPLKPMLGHSYEILLLDPAVHGRGRRRLITALLGGEQAKNAIYVLKSKI